MRLLLLCVSLLLSASAPASIIETVAGGAGPEGFLASASTLGTVKSAAYRGGEWYVLISDKYSVIRIDGAGILHHVAGTWGKNGATSEGIPALGNRLMNPSAIALDAAGNLYITDTTFNRIYKVDAYSGFISNFAGGNFISDNPATALQLSNPSALAADASKLYIADTGGNIVRSVDLLTGATANVAGTGSFGGSFADGIPASSAVVGQPTALYLSGGQLYVASYVYIHRIDLGTGLHYRVAGNGSQASTADSLPAFSSPILSPVGLYADPSGNVYFLEGDRLRVVVDGYIDMVAQGFNGYGSGIAVGGGTMALCLGFSAELRGLSLPSLAATSLLGAGGRHFAGDGGLGINALMEQSEGVAAAADGTVYFADGANGRVRKVSPSGVISTIAGTGSLAVSGVPGPATAAGIGWAQSLALDEAGNRLFIGVKNHYIFVLDLGSGQLYAYAGNGGGVSGTVDPLPADQAATPYVYGLAYRPSTGELFAACPNNSIILKIAPNTATLGGTVSLLAGDNGSAAYADGLGVLAKFNYPVGLAVDDASGTVYVADRNNNRVRAIDTAGNVSTAVGSGGVVNYPGLSTVQGVALSGSSQVIVTRHGGNNIILADLVGGTYSTLAGTGTKGYGGDGGDPLAADLDEPFAVALASNGDLVFSDSNNRRIRRISSSPLFTPTYTPTVTATFTDSPVVSPTVTRTSSPTRTPTPTITATFSRTGTSTTTPTPAPACPGGAFVGSATTYGFSGTGFSNYVMYLQITAPMTGQASTVYFYVAANGGSTADVGLYTDATNAPGTLIAGYRTAVTLVTGWNAAALNTPAAVTSGSKYWIAVRTAGTLTQMNYGTSGSGRVQTGQVALPATATTSASIYQWPFYVDVCPAATATPTATASATRTPTFSASPTAPGTFTISPTRTSTISPTFSDSPTPYITPTPYCASQYLAGQPLLMPNAFPGTWANAQKVDLPVSSHLSLVRAYVTFGAGAQIKACLYTGTASAPTSLSITSAPITAVTGWNEIPISTPNLAPGTWWISIVNSTGTLQIVYNSGSNGYYATSANSYASPASTFPAGGLAFDYSISAVFCADGTPTITPTPTLTFTPYPCLGNEWPIGVQGQQPTGVNLNLYSLAQKLTVSASSNLYTAGVYVQNPTGASLIAAIYADSTVTAGTPGNLIATSQPVLAVTGLNTVRFNAVTLNPGVTYWLHFAASNGTLQTFYNGSGTGGWINTSVGASFSPPAVFPAGGLALYSYSFSGGVCFIGTATPTRSNTATPSVTATPTYDDRSATNTPSITVTSTPSATPSPSATRTGTISPTRTASRTITTTPTMTATATVTRSFTMSQTQTPAPSSTPYGSATATVPPTAGLAFDTWVPEGTVNVVVSDGSTLWLGGSFSWVGPRVSGGVAFDSASKALLNPWPRVLDNGASIPVVAAAVGDGQGGFYVGGSFTSIGGVARKNLAHILANGTVDANFYPDPDGGVNALVLRGDRLYVGGGFYGFDNGPLPYTSWYAIACLDAQTGALRTDKAPQTNTAATIYAIEVVGEKLYFGGTFSGGTGYGNRGRLAAWQPGVGYGDFRADANSDVRALAYDNGRLYVGGFFSTLSNTSRVRIAAVDAGNGALLSWYPTGGATGGSADVASLAVNGTSLYVGGGFTSIGGVSRNYLAGLSTVDASVLTHPTLGSSVGGGLPHVDKVYYSAGTGKLYVGGQYNNVNGTEHPGFNALDPATSAIDASMPVVPNTTNPNTYVYTIAESAGATYVGGQLVSVGALKRVGVAAIDLATGAATSFVANAMNGTIGGQITAMALDGSRLYFGGLFTTVNGSTRGSLAAVDKATGALDGAFNASASVDNTPSSLAVLGGNLYLGGYFNQLNGTPRSYLGALDSSGNLLPWNPSASGGQVFCLLPDLDRIYVGGAFTSVGGQSRSRLAVLDASGSTGYALSSFTLGVNSQVNALAKDGDTLYVAGSFTTLGGVGRVNLGAASVAGNTVTAFAPNVGGSLSALSQDPYSLYVGGNFLSLAGQTRYYVGAFDKATGSLATWNGGMNGGAVKALASPANLLIAGGDHWYAGGMAGKAVAVLQGVITPTPIGTYTITPTFTESQTWTASPTVTVTPTISETNTDSPTPTATRTVTETASPTATRSATPTATETATPTATRTITATATESATRTASGTVTPTRTETPPFTYTATPSSTGTPSATRTWTASPTVTVSSTQSVTPTFTATRTATQTASSTATPTWTPTATPTATPSQTTSRTATPTASPTASPTQSLTFTGTRSFTPTGTVSFTGTVTLTPTPTASFTATKTVTLTSTISPTFTVSPTASPTPTISPTFTPIQFLASDASVPPVALGPNPVKQGSPLCLYTKTGVLSSTWTVYNAVGQRVAALAFGSDPSQCMATSTLAVGGPYRCIIKTSLADGTTHTDIISVTIAAP